MMSDQSPAQFHRFGAVSVRLSVELGRTEMPLRDVLALGEGSTVALDRLTDELLDVTANGRVIARGEVVAEKGRFALRIVHLVGEDGQEVQSAPADPAAGLADAV
jgi:flagellar motor switch protein FliN/FliY